MIFILKARTSIGDVMQGLLVYPQSADGTTTVLIARTRQLP